MTKKSLGRQTKRLNVLVTTPIDRKSLRMIADVCTNIKVRDVSNLVIEEEGGSSEAEKRLDEFLAEAEVIYGARLPRKIVARSPKLRWIHSKLAGVDKFLDDDLVKSKLILTNSRGVYATQVSEFVLQQMLMFVKNAPLYFRHKQEKRWEKEPHPVLLKDKTLGLVGFGTIGRTVAYLAKAFGMRVVAFDIRKSVRSRYVDLFFHNGELKKLLSQSDFVVVVVPLTAQTKKMIGKAEFKAMKSTAYFINVSRGPVVDENALIHSLTKNLIAGAGLDVFTIEPLPADSKIWELQNVIFSPHVAGLLPNWNEIAAEFFCQNLKRFLNGERLHNRVNKKRGY